VQLEGLALLAAPAVCCGRDGDHGRDMVATAAGAHLGAGSVMLVFGELNYETLLGLSRENVVRI
jgi:hypothetical protein